MSTIFPGYSPGFGPAGFLPFAADFAGVFAVAIGAFCQESALI